MTASRRALPWRSRSSPWRHRRPRTLRALPVVPRPVPVSTRRTGAECAHRRPPGPAHSRLKGAGRYRRRSAPGVAVRPAMGALWRRHGAELCPLTDMPEALPLSAGLRATPAEQPLNFAEGDRPEVGRRDRHPLRHWPPSRRHRAGPRCAAPGGTYHLRPRPRLRMPAEGHQLQPRSSPGASARTALPTAPQRGCPLPVRDPVRLVP